MSPKLLLSIALSLLCLLAPTIYMPNGSWTELTLLSMITLLSMCVSGGLYYNRTLAQSSRARRAQLPFDSFFTPALWGAWLSVFGALISLLPVSSDLLALLSTQITHDWLEFKKNWEPINRLSAGSTLESFSVSLSPAHSWHWIVLQLNWIVLIYLSGLTRGLRRPLLFALAFMGPLLALIALIHAVGDANLLYFYIQSADRVQLSGFITALINPNHAASLLMLSGFVALGLAYEIDSNPLTVSEQKTKTLSQVFKLSCTLSSIALLFTSSRAAIGIYLAMLGLWLLRHKLSWENFRRLLVLSTVCLCILLPICTMLLAKQDWSSTQDMVKVQSWLDSLMLICRYFPWGTGRESFGEVFTHYQSFKTMNWVSHPENQIIRNIAEAGLIGVISMLCYGWAWWKWWKLESIQSHSLSLSLGLGVTAVILHQNYDFGIESLGVMIPVACAWGLMWSYQPSPSVFAVGEGGTSTQKLRSKRERIYKKRASAWYKSLQQSVLISLLSLVALCALGFKSSPIRRVIKQYERSSDVAYLVTESLKHPLSAHFSTRLASSPSLSLEERLLWVKRSRRLAPTWSSPLVLEARSFHQAGFDDLAALNYRNLLLRFPEKRNLIFQDLMRFPLSYKYADCLPKEYWYSFYKQYKEVDHQAADQFLRSLSSKQVSLDLNVRALYIRYVVPSCSESDLELLSRLANEYRTQLKVYESDNFKSLDRKYCLIKQDLITYKAAAEICMEQKSSRLSKLQSRSMLYSSLEKESCYAKHQKELDARAEKSFFSLRKILKNR